MRILMPNHFPLQGSGCGIYTLNVAHELVRLGHEVLVIVPEYEPIPPERYPFSVETILFDNGNYNLNAEAILREIKTGSKTTEGQYASQYALADFSRSGQIAKMIELYQPAIKQ